MFPEEALLSAGVPVVAVPAGLDVRLVQKLVRVKDSSKSPFVIKLRGTRKKLSKSTSVVSRILPDVAVIVEVAPVKVSEDWNVPSTTSIVKKLSFIFRITPIAEEVPPVILSLITKAPDTEVTATFIGNLYSVLPPNSVYFTLS